MARQIAQTRQARERNAQLAKRRGQAGRSRTSSSRWRRARSQELNLILKGDVSGSVEALEDALLKIDVGEEVNLRVIHRGVGAITENDVTLARASKAVIIGFNVRPEGKVAELADREEGVDVRYYSVIYQAIEEIEAALKGMLKPDLRGGPARHRRGARGLQVAASSAPSPAALVRSGRDQPQQQGAPDPRRCRGGGQPHDRSSAPVQGRRHRGPRGLRVRHRPGHFNDIKVDDVIETFEMREKPRKP